MKLSTRSRYGARLLAEIAKQDPNDPIPASEIARRTNVSVKYLEHLISKLNKHGILNSVRGPKGGQILVRDPKTLTVGEVVRLLENDLSLVECIDHPECCGKSADCPARKMWMKTRDAMLEVLDGITIHDLSMDNV